MIDLAVYELEAQGILRRDFLREQLPDGEPDYEMALTEHGRQAYLQKEPLEFLAAE